MKMCKFSTHKSVEEACKEIEKMIPCVLGTKPNKAKEDDAIIYYPARRFAGEDDLMDDVRIVVRKVNNSLTSIKLEDLEDLKNTDPIFVGLFGENRRLPMLEKAYEVLSNVLLQMFPKEN